MNIHPSTLLGREDLAEGTMAFHLSKPGGFAFAAGQAIDLILPNSVSSHSPSDAASANAQDVRHAFSIVSAPFEEQLTIATRMRDSDYKRALKALPIGAAASIDGPFGSLTLHRERSRAAVFIAGGIGITPFVSMLRQAARQQLQQRLILLYSSRRPEDAAFLAELQQLQERNSQFKLVATMTDMQLSSRSWPNQTGLITAELVARAVADLPQPIFYVVGPPGMVEAMRQTLVQRDIDPADIRSEEFHGY
jgi:ferredoxin-NADP reductase